MLDGMATRARDAAFKVSVLMPMRNPGRFLAPALDSVLGQDYRNIELVVIDDGSDDGSRERILARGDRRVVLVDGPRAGISACLNVGLASVTGGIVMRCDADDLYPRGRVARQVAWLESHPDFVAVCAGFSMVGPDAQAIASPFRDMVDEQVDAAVRILDGRLKTHLCTFAVRRVAMDAVHGFRTFFETAEDIDFALRLAERGPIGFDPFDAYLYRLHGTSITHTQASVRRLFFERVAREMSVDRRDCGSDDLMRGTPPQPPAGELTPASSASEHMAQLLVGESWQHHKAGRKRAAIRSAWLAIRSRPASIDGWKALALVALRPAGR